MTQEFHISITPIRDDEYLVRTEEVAPGVPLAEEQFVWPVADWLTLARQLMNDPIVGLLRGDRIHPPGHSAHPSHEGYSQHESLSSLVQLGQQLYSNLFQGRLRDSWMTAQGIAQHRGEALRLRLGLKGHQLPSLPWEVLNGGVNEGIHISTRHLATGTDILFSRYLADAGMGGMMPHPAMPKLQRVVNILMAIAAPTDQQQLKLKQEAYHLQEELRLRANVLQSGMGDRLPDIRVTVLEQPGREELAHALEQGNYQVFHFAGHSDLGTAGGQLYLVNRQTGLSEPLSGNDLAGLLFNNKIQMAVFNSCRGAHTATAASQSRTSGMTLTEALVNRGIPAVLAMAEQIPDDVALSLTRLFYRNLKQDYPVDLSLSRARQGLLSAYSSNQLYWALPILYMHPEFNGYMTAGDRSLDNPADSLIRLPHLHSSPLTDSFATVNQSLDNADIFEPIGSVDETVEPDDDVIRAVDMASVTDDAIADSGSITDTVMPVVSNMDTSVHPSGRPEASGSFAFQVSPQEVEDHLEPQDAPAVGEDLELPEDFFLADEELETFDNHPFLSTDFDDDENVDSDLLDESLNESFSVRHLVEELEESTQTGIHGEVLQSEDESQPLSQDWVEHASENRSSFDSEPSADVYATSSSDEVEVDDESTDSYALAYFGHETSLKPPEEPSSPSEQLSTQPLALMRSQRGLSKTSDQQSTNTAVLHSRRTPWRKVILLPLASVAGAVIVVLGYRFIPAIEQPTSTDVVVTIPDGVTRDNLADKPTRAIVDFGIASFAASNLEDGQAAVEELLNRDELEQAARVLDSIPDVYASKPVVSFLQGRLAWQDLQQGNPNFSLQDASQFWGYAAQKSNQPLYYNALGFALYSEGRTREAIDAWESALYALEDEGINILPDGNSRNLSSQDSEQIKVGVPQRPLSNQDALTAYAGIALAMTQLSASSAVEQPFDLLNQAVQIRQVVLQSPNGFTPTNSAHNWLWTEALVTEWEIFKDVSSQ